MSGQARQPCLLGAARTPIGKFGGGLIATVDDTNVAATRVERILSVARLMTMGGGVAVDEGDVVRLVRDRADIPAVVVHRGDRLLGGLAGSKGGAQKSGNQEASNHHRSSELDQLPPT